MMGILLKFVNLVKLLQAARKQLLKVEIDS